MILIMKNLEIILIITFSILTGCEDISQNIVKTSFDIQLTKNQSYEYNTRIGGDEEGAEISIQANHFSISEIVRDASTIFVAVYKYTPDLDYKGADMVEIKTSTGSDGASPSTNFEYITIHFTITE
jgi:hypothetical protein